MLEPITITSLKDACVGQLERHILSGTFKTGDRLPSERDLARMLGVSRPVVHQALVDLDAKGLVSIEPRRGVFVNDYRRSGSIALLTTLLEYSKGEFNPSLYKSLLEGRLLIETENAKLAALNRTPQQLERLIALGERGEQSKDSDPKTLTEYDFRFHQEIAVLSGNEMYPLLINSLQSVHQNLAGRFYQAYFDTQIIQEVLDFHAALIKAIEIKNSQQAAQTMAEMLKHGEKHMLEIFPSS
jgi:DNA-binding FadR family transcriptional regulator